MTISREAIALRQARVRLLVLIIIAIMALLRACAADLTFFEDGSGMVSWCEPFNPCAEYTP